ncbi:MAG: N-acetyltransferase family protein [Solirubrobacterales bacterium]
MVIERLAPEHAAKYRALMLEAYAAHPEAFTSSVAERENLSLTWWKARLSVEPDAKKLVLGAFDDDELAGVVGLSFEQREKARHKATLFGMYVRPQWRSRGIGRQLVLSALTHAHQRPGVKVIQLTVTEGNVPAVALYESCGFVRFGVEPMAIAVGSKYLSKIHMWQQL